MNCIKIRLVAGLCQTHWGNYITPPDLLALVNRQKCPEIYKNLVLKFDFSLLGPLTENGMSMKCLVYNCTIYQFYLLKLTLTE